MEILYLVFGFLLVVYFGKYANPGSDKFEPEPINGARWADNKMMRGLFKQKGMLIGFVGKYLGRRIYFDPTAPGISPHRMTIGGTGKGKTTQKTIVGALGWKWSLIALDVGGELAAQIGTARKQFGRSVQWNPYGVNREATKDIPTVRINPVARLNPKSPTYWNDIEKLAKACIHQGLNDSKQRFWYKGSTDLVGAIIASEIDCGEKRNRHLPRVRQVLCGNVHEYARDVCKRTKNPNIRSLWISYAAYGAEKNDPLRDIIINARSEMEWLRDPVLAEALSHDDISFKDCKDKIITFFVVVPQNDLEVISTVLRAVCGFALNDTFQLVGKNIPIQFVIDEYYALQAQGKLEAIDVAYAAGRKFSLFLWILIQNWPELLQVQGNLLAHHMLNSAGCVEWMSLQRDILGAHALSELCGEADVIMQSQNTVEGRDGSSMTLSMGSRKLALPHELMNLAHNQQIVFVDGVDAPILCERKPYWEIPEFKHRVKRSPFYKG